MGSSLLEGMLPMRGRLLSKARVQTKKQAEGKVVLQPKTNPPLHLATATCMCIGVRKFQQS
jgi:hypothetical protein